MSKVSFFIIERQSLEHHLCKYLNLHLIFIYQSKPVFMEMNYQFKEFKDIETYHKLFGKIFLIKILYVEKNHQCI